MNVAVFLLYFASAISTLLVIYAAYMMVRDSRANFANAFKIIIGGHIPGVIVNLVNAFEYFDIGIIPPESTMLRTALNHIAQIFGTLSIFLAIYMVKKELYDKISKFTKKLKGKRNG